MGCWVERPPEDEQQQQQLAAAEASSSGSSSSQRRRQQQQRVPGFDTQTLFRSAGTAALAGVAQQPKQQTVLEEEVPGEQQQQQQGAPTAAIAVASRGTKLSGGVASTASPQAGAGSAPQAAYKPWQRVSCAIRWASKLLISLPVCMPACSLQKYSAFRARFLSSWYYAFGSNSSNSLGLV
jgi:hypothetical protein